jgi:hypothetical protein
MEILTYIIIPVFVFVFYILYRSNSVQSRGDKLLDKTNDLNERAIKIIERQEALVDRQEKLMSRLEKIKIPE